jgi:hypothetical protein
MRSASLRVAAVCAIAALAFATPASSAIVDFRGAWVNADPATRGLSQIAIRSEGSQVFVHAWGRCHPRDCDWGEIPARIFTPNVGVPMDAGADTVIAQFDQGAIQTMVFLEKSDGDLNYKVFTIFSDARSSYHTSGRMNRR